MKIHIFTLSTYPLPFQCHAFALSLPERERENFFFVNPYPLLLAIFQRDWFLSVEMWMSEDCTSASDCLLATAAPGSVTVAASGWPSFVNSFEGSSEQPPPCRHQGKLRCLWDWKLMSSPTKLRQTHCWQQILSNDENKSSFMILF